jgi:glucan-binding YG repeat protein
MATLKEVLDFYKYLANNGLGIDNDGAYGYQCADVPAYLAYHYFGKWLWGNAINLLDSAAAQGFEVIYEGPGVIAKAGDVFVMEVPGSPYGHTGLVIEDSDGYTLKTIEQNIDGNWDFLEVGGPARYNTRSYSGMVGFIRFPYGSETPEVKEGWVKDDQGWWYRNQDGSYPKNQWKTIGGNLFRFDGNGYILEKQWFKDEEDGQWYWLREGGYMATGWVRIGESWYFFNSDGSMKTGWVSYFDKWYYLKESNGAMVSEEVRNVDGDWYYFDKNGEMLSKATVYVDDSGRMHFK